MVVHKPRGLTSFDIVRRVRRFADMRKVGHTGTLDPEATGVLPVALGRCTRLSKFLTLDDKRYQFTMRLGEATETGDTEGEVVRTEAWEHLRREDIEDVLSNFVGEIEQVPPVYSAIKIDGKRAHELARAGEEVELEARTVRVDELKIIDWRPQEIDLDVRCGPGTYVRSLASDIAAAVDTVAHTTMIHRLRVGPFTIEDAVRLEELEEDFWDQALPPLEMMRTLPKLGVDDEGRDRLRHGQPVEAPGQWDVGDAVAIHDDRQMLVAVAEFRSRYGQEAKLWPKRVMI